MMWTPLLSEILLPRISATVVDIAMMISKLF